MSEQESNKATYIRAWRTGGPLTPAQRKEAKSLFLEGLKKLHCVMLACEFACISRRTVYRWKDIDEKFASEWGNVIERSRDVARASIYQRGILGWDEHIVSMGQAVYELEPVLDSDGNPQLDNRGRPLVRQGKPLMLHKWSDTLAVAYAKANLSEYKDKPQVDLQVQLSDLAEKAKEEVLADLAAAFANENQEQAPSG